MTAITASATSIAGNARRVMMMKVTAASTRPPK